MRANTQPTGNHGGLLRACRPLFMTPRNRIIALVFSGIAGLAAIHSGLVAEMIPNAPVTNFRIPMFNEEGYRSWELAGAQGIYVDGTHVDVVEMVLKIYSGDGENEVQTKVTSPDATVLLEENRALGKNSILILNRDFKITGQNWVWNGENDSFAIEGRVVVTFHESIGDILK